MPTVLRFGAFRVAIYFNDHRPPHVHVIGSGCQAVFLLNCSEGPVLLRENCGLRQTQLTKIEQQLNIHVRNLCKEWKNIHGNA